MIEAFYLNEKDTKRRAWLVHDLVTYYWKTPGLSQEFRTHPEYRNVMNEIIEWGESNPENYHSASINLFNFFIVSSVLDATDDNLQNEKYIENYIDAAELISKTILKSEKEYAVKVDFFKDAISYWQNNTNKILDAYKFKFCGIFFTGIDAEVGSGKNKQQRKFTMSKEFINQIILENQDYLWMPFSYGLIVERDLASVTASLRLNE